MSQYFLTKKKSQRRIFIKFSKSGLLSGFLLLGNWDDENILQEAISLIPLEEKELQKVADFLHCDIKKTL